MGFVRFQDLEVYRLAETVADDLWAIVNKWGQFAQDTIGKQLTRAVDSIGANIAEGSGKGGGFDNRRFVLIARGSFNETQHWLRRAFARGLLTPEQVESIRVRMNALGPKLNAYLSTFARPPKTAKAYARGTRNAGYQPPKTKH